MLSVSNISVQFGEKCLFKDVNFHISPHDRIGLVGSNGVGKTTLLKILAGIAQPDSGNIQKANYVTVGYLPQDTVSFSENTLYNEVKTAFSDINVLHEQLEQINSQLLNFPNHESEEYQELLEIQSEIQFKLDSLDAHSMESRIKKVLFGLGFFESDFFTPVKKFSGGWQMRIALAKLLLSNPSLLLLDEPTNHLDLDSLRWLEDYLHSYKGATIIVSHDRAFLDNMTRKTFLIFNGKLEIFNGNYTFYENEHKTRKEQLLKAVKNQQQMINQTQRFIERFRYKATKARQVQSRIKQLEKLEVIEIENEEEEISFNFPEVQQSGEIVVEASNLSKCYPIESLQEVSKRNKVVFTDLNFRIERGDRIAIVGVNGSGKSTLTKILSGIEQPSSGNLKYGHKVTISYFSQHQIDELQGDMDVLQVAASEASGQTVLQVRKLLGCFLFKGDDVFKKVNVLSGGEKSRLALVKMLLKPANFLILDEPTNHLDMKSKKVLQEALKNFDGSYVIVSHDRYFLDPIVNKVMEIKSGKMKIYLGNISEYIERKELEVSEPISDQKKNETHFRSIKDKKRVEAEERQKLYKLTKSVKDKIAQIEKLIEEKENSKHECERIMADPNFFSDKQRVVSVNNDYKKLISELNELYNQWTDLSEELEQIIKDFKKNAR